VYMDRDWIDGDGPMNVSSAIFVHGEEVRSPSGAMRLVGSSDRDRVVWTMIDTLAAAVAEEAGQRSAVARVLGGGLLASRIRARITMNDDVTEPAEVVIETTGSAAGTTRACSVAADLGTVLLAVTPLEGTLSYDLYPDVHRRGLNLVGVPDPAGDSHHGQGSMDAFSPPSQIASGEPSPPTSQWFVART
jgi:threonine dehydrogenase-like Zn-dependent dehydrogenase